MRGREGGCDVMTPTSPPTPLITHAMSSNTRRFPFLGSRKLPSLAVYLGSADAFNFALHAAASVLHKGPQKLADGGRK